MRAREAAEKVVTPAGYSHRTYCTACCLVAYNFREGLMPKLRNATAKAKLQRNPDERFGELDEIATDTVDMVCTYDNIHHKFDVRKACRHIVTEHAEGNYGPRSQFTLGDYYYGLKEYDKARESYQAFLDRFPADKLTAQDRALPRKAKTLLGHLGEIDAYNLYSAGEKLFDEKKYDEAVKIFKEVQQKYPQSDQAVNSLVNIAAAHMAQEEYREAGAIFQKVVDNYGDNPKYLPQVDFAKQQLEAMQEARVL